MSSSELVAWLLCVGLAAGCATPSYVGFHERYAGTCQVTPPAPSGEAASAGVVQLFAGALNDQEEKLRQCYSDSLRYGETHGKIKLQLGLRADGVIDPLTLLSDTTGFPALACCVVAVVRGLRVPAASGRAAVSFEYPFSFHTVRTTDAMGLGVPWSSSHADRDGYVAELDESTVVIAGTILYPVAADGYHYHSDVKQSDDAANADTAAPN